MGMAATQSHWTVDKVRALPDDGQRHEIIDGELLVTPRPSYDHQEAVFAIARRLAAYLAVHRVGHAALAPLDVVFGEQTLVQPDVFVVPLAHGKRPRNAAEAGVPLLTIEVISPNSARADRGRKRELYLRQGVPEYRIVDMDARVIERWRRGETRPEILSERMEWQPDPWHEPLAIDLGEYWREVLGE